MIQKLVNSVNLEKAVVRPDKKFPLQEAKPSEETVKRERERGKNKLYM